MGNLDHILQGFHSLPTPYNDANGLKIEMWNLNGTITTPWFAQEYVKDYYQESKEFLVVLQLPGDIKYKIGSGSLNIDLEVHTRKETEWVEEVTLYTTNDTMYTTNGQQTNNFRGKKTINLTYTKDAVNFSSFRVCNKYKTASQELLESWKDKKMTVFRLNWWIQDPNMNWSRGW